MGKDKIKIGILCICLNEPYWQYAQEMIEGLNRYFLKHHTIRDKYETEIMLWSDMPETSFAGKVFPTEPVEWPLPTLLRYNLFLQQEEELRKYDHLFYIDVDMRITDWIGEEILGDGLTAAEHPMYALRQNLCPPYEPNPDSTAYIKRPGKVIVDSTGKPRFKPEYYAGGFQGGKTEDFIKAMKVMRANIDKDFNNNYVAIWNDESHWNKFLSENPPVIVLNPSYIYPDSLVSEYYVRVWGRNYSPKIMTLTKAFTISKEGGEATANQLRTM